MFATIFFLNNEQIKNLSKIITADKMQRIYIWLISLFIKYV